MTHLQSLFRRNLPAKLLALVVAVVLWFFVMNDQNPSIDGSFTVPLSVVNVPDNCKIVKADESVKIKVRGPRSLFVSAVDSEFKAYVDLNELENGKHSVKVQTVLPQGFELLETSPDITTVTIDKIVQRQIRAEFIVTGSVAPGMAVANLTPSVTTVTIEGPQSSLDTVTRVIGYVGLSNNHDDFKVSVALTALNAEGRGVEDVRVVPNTVDVSVQLARGLSKKFVTVKPVFDGALPSGYSLGNVRVDPAQIEIAGETDKIAAVVSLDTEKIELSDVTQADAAKRTAQKDVQLVLPDGITVTNKRVNVTIEIIEKKS